MIEGAGPGAAFWGLSVLTLAAAGGGIVSRNLFHAVLFLILVFLGIAGFFLLLSADFLAMAQIIIYVGAIPVLILFAIVLTPRASRDNGETRMAPAALVVAIGVAGLLIPAIADTDWRTLASAPALPLADLGRELLGTWVLPFQLASVLLTAALVGAVMLVRSPREEQEELEEEERR